MEYILGVLTTVCLFEAYLLYQKPKQTQQQITEAEKEAERERQKHMDALLNYDVKKAYGGKR